MTLKSFFSWFNPEPETMQIRNWKKLRNAYLAENSACVICGSTENLVAHHLLDVSRHPQYMYEWNNLITLCNGSNKIKGLRCHLTFAHLYNWNQNNYNLLTHIPILREILIHKREGCPERLKETLGFK